MVFAWLLVLTLHYLWLRTGAKWTSLGVFFPVFAGVTLALVSLLPRVDWSHGLLRRTLLGAACGYVACIAAWLIADAVMAPERLGIVRGALQSSPFRSRTDRRPHHAAPRLITGAIPTKSTQSCF
jgi:hypothetical protein